MIEAVESSGDGVVEFDLRCEACGGAVYERGHVRYVPLTQGHLEEGKRGRLIVCHDACQRDCDRTQGSGAFPSRNITSFVLDLVFAISRDEWRRHFELYPAVLPIGDGAETPAERAKARLAQHLGLSTRA